MMSAFLKSVAVGTLAAGALPVMLAMIMAVVLFIEPISGERSFAVFLAPLLVLALVFACVTIGATIFGLPGTWLLDRLELRSERDFVIMGVISALLTSIVICLLGDAWSGLSVLAICGVPGGMMAGRTWFLLRNANVR